MEKSTGFAQVKGQRIVDGSGQVLRLRGVGLGNWLLPEGYMWKFHSPTGDRPRRIEAVVRELAGDGYAQAFWQQYRTRYITEEDIIRIRQEGFNSVRLPINARTIWHEGTVDEYIPEGLALIDQLMVWCERHALYVILDLHGAPGGQTGANIDDSISDFPDLFTDPHSRQATLKLWQMLARRYRDSRTVLGYDLLNEPLAPPFRDRFFWDLAALYSELTAAIRAVDPHHIIIVEGAVWATDWSLFTQSYDKNLVFAFHKYWSAPDTSSIQKYLDARRDLDAPIWMGEGGENHPDWLYACFRLYEDHDIGWNFWPWKKMDTETSPYSIRLPQHWDQVMAYVEEGVVPDANLARLAFDSFLSNMALDQACYRPQVVDALFGRARPGLRLPAVYFGYRGSGLSYHARTANTHPFRSGDGPRIANQRLDTVRLPAFRADMARDREDQLLLWLLDGEWVRYDLAADQPLRLSPQVMVETDEANARLWLGSKLEEVDQGIAIGLGEAHVVQFPEVTLDQGEARLYARCTGGSVRLAWIEL